jgi:signal transduction histidine kinase/CheY-like chemotaxis protein
MNTTAERGEAHETRRREVLIELVGLHAHALLRMPWVMTLLVAGVALFLLQYVQLGGFLAWGALTIGVEIWRALFAARVLRRGYDIDPRRVHRQFVLLAACAGLSIGLGSTVLLPQLPILPQALFGAVLFAIPAAGVAVSQSSRYIVGAYAVCILFPGSTTWGLIHPSQAVGLAALTVLFCAVIVLAAADGDKLLLRSVSIRHERDRLVLDLRQRNAQVQAAVAQAEQSAQARARVLAAASHDLRQPLHALSLYSAVLAANPAPETLRELSQSVDQIVRSLGNLLNGLLDLSRLSAGYYVPERQPLALDEIVAGVCAEMRGAAARKGIALVQDLQPVRLLGDPVALGRIARNLVDNAIKYTDHGEVRAATRIQTEGGATCAVLSVRDTGRGIPQAEQGRIFEEFYQLDNPGRDRSLGVGLGLAIVQRLCELTGARITLESAPQRGTCFEVRMPIEAGDTIQPLPAPGGAEEGALPGRTVYVVDDERDIRRGMGELLGVWGMTVLCAATPEEASRLFDAHGRPHLMIVDLRLGQDEHGARLAERMQRVHGDFPVLIITGETSSQALLQANERGYALLQKPIPPEVLRQAIARLLGAVQAGLVAEPAVAPQA